MNYGFDVDMGSSINGVLLLVLVVIWLDFDLFLFVFIEFNLNWDGLLSWEDILV